MKFFLLAFAIGIIAGLRAMTAPAVTSGAARLGILVLGGSKVGFMGMSWTPWIFSLAAVGELITDQLPSTPSRKVPPQFITRVVMGALCGYCFGTLALAPWAGALCGALGAVAGTLGGAAARAKLAAAFNKDLPAALIEDCVAVLGGIAIVWAAR